MIRTLVTGGTGFIGSNLVKRLVDSGYAVRVFDNNFRGKVSKLGEYVSKIELVEGDICDPQAVDGATAGIDWVFHLAFINGTRNFYEIPHKVLDVGIRGALNTIDASIKHKVKKYIVASSAEVYQEPTHVPTTEEERLIIPDIHNPRYSYGGGKMVCELLALHMAPHHGLHTVVFRPHNIYGPDMGEDHVIPQFVRRMQALPEEGENKAADFFIQGTGDETRAFCYVEDAARGILLCAEKGKTGNIYHLGTQEEISIRALAERVSSCLGLNIRVRSGEISKGSTSKRCPSIQKARQELGYEPTISLSDGLGRTCAWYIKNAPDDRFPPAYPKSHAYEVKL